MFYWFCLCPSVVYLCLSLPCPILCLSCLLLCLSPSSSLCLVRMPPSHLLFLCFPPLPTPAPRLPPPSPHTHSHLPQTAPSHRLSLSRALIRCLVTALPSSLAETIATGSPRRGHSSLFCPLQARGRSNYRYSVGGDAFVCSPFTESRLPGPEAAERCLTKAFCASSQRPPLCSRTSRALTQGYLLKYPTLPAVGSWAGRAERWVHGPTDRLT